MKTKIISMVVFGMLWFTPVCFSEDQIDTDMVAFFSNDEFFIQADELEDKFVKSERKEGIFDFSGYFEIDARYSISSDQNESTVNDIVKLMNRIPDSWLNRIAGASQYDVSDINDAFHIGQNHWSEIEMEANLITAMQFNDYIKGVINLDATFSPSGSSYTQNLGSDSQNDLGGGDDPLDVSVNEAFFDTNLGDKVFLKTGKQVLQWGRGFLFNPTDLINRERKNVLDMNANREGTYGIKAHIPFGVKYNIYSFLDFGNDEDFDYFAYALKFEILLDKTELSVSAWNGEDGDPVFGFDFSSRLKTVDIFGELSLSSKETIQTPKSTSYNFV